MRAHRARRLVAASAVSVLLAGGASIGAAGTAAAAAPAVHPQVTTNMCFGRSDFRCFDRGGFRFDHSQFCFNHPGFCFGNHFGNRFDHRFDHRFFNNGSFVIIVF
ncbi:hypothetical protein [Streptomyces sp. HUAS TT20]|uniref:hypothetical protein n=1 Tax=Streptomyces sp. HUAS TT20 TaxID=3447509 RepID=UPI0021DB5BA7|nr:hypothetical protein [Streptomyces sp. HUAS 15-9]UXY31804.1 hypothetical protein N8I87_38155 [Streptomyces sp. HUAS 15-9]